MRYIYKVFLALNLFLAVNCCALDAKDEELAIRASVDKKSIFIGDRIRYTVEVRSKKDLDVELPKFEDGKIGGFEIKDFTARVKRGLFGKNYFSNRYYITTYSVGKHVIPQVEIRYRAKGANDWAVKTTGPIDITVSSILERGQRLSDIRDIKGPLYYFEVNWALFISALAVIFIFVSFFFAYKKRRKKIPSKLPHETAFEELEALRGFLAETGDVKEYYVRISDCVRRYIEMAFKLKAPEMTTEEFLNSLRDSAVLSFEYKELLKDFLASCDLVKFAKYAPTTQERELVFSTAKKFVEETKGACLVSGVR